MKTKMATYRIEGGFHGVEPIGFRAPAGLTTQDALSWVMQYAPRAQARLDRHFCGIRSCQCGGAARGRKAS